MSSPPPPNLLVPLGTVIAGKYRVDRLLGQGGMGVVVAAHHLQLDQPVALKFLRPEAAESGEAVGRFLREARAAVRIKSEHVGRILDVGELPTGAPYIVMEYLEGMNLSERLRSFGPMPAEQASRFLLQACEALAEAHVLGIVHRDLKPANLFCIRRPDGQLSIKVLDFGISKLLVPDEGAQAMTATSAVLGSPYYMSPEQMRASKSVDARSDVWSLGVILFELMTGRPPFQSEALTDLAVKVCNEPTPRLREFAPDAPPELDNVIQRCLEKDVAKRFQDVGQLAAALRDVAGARGGALVERVQATLDKGGSLAAGLADTASLAVMDRAAAPTLALTNSEWGGTAKRTSPKRRLALGWGGAAVLTTAALVGVGVWGRRGPSVAGTPSATAALLPPALPREPVAAATLPAPSASAAPVPVSVAPPPSPSTESSKDKELAHPPRPAASKPQPTAKTAPRPAPHVPSCTLVSRFDREGQEHFVEECK